MQRNDKQTGRKTGQIILEEVNQKGHEYDFFEIGETLKNKRFLNRRTDQQSS